MPAYPKLYKRTFEVGRRYRLGLRTYRCVRATVKGINFLDEKLWCMLRKDALHDPRWSRKHVPRNIKKFTVLVSAKLRNLQPIEDEDTRNNRMSGRRSARPRMVRPGSPSQPKRFLPR